MAAMRRCNRESSSPASIAPIVAIAPVTDLNFLKEESRGWTDFRLLSDFIGSGPHVREGSPAANAEAIRAPVLIFHGDHDANVSIQHGRLMERRLRGAGKRVELVTFPGLDHGLVDSAAARRHAPPQRCLPARGARDESAAGGTIELGARRLLR